MKSSNHAALSRFLERLLRRSDLSAEEQSAILGVRSHASQVSAYRDVVSLGEQVQHSCLVVDGLMGRFDQMKDGRRQITALHIPGDMCDLHSLVWPTPGWGLEAMTTTTVLHIPRSDLRQLAAAHPAIALAFWRDTTADASVLAKWVGNLGRRDAASRLAHLFCEIGMRMEQADLGTRTEFVLLMTQTQIADALGLTSVHVNRMLQVLRGDRVLRTDRRTIHVEDWGRLTQIAEFNPDFLLIEPMKQAA